jgi:hypothetical protein
LLTESSEHKRNQKLLAYKLLFAPTAHRIKGSSVSIEQLQSFSSVPSERDENTVNRLLAGKIKEYLSDFDVKNVNLRNLVIKEYSLRERGKRNERGCT